MSKLIIAKAIWELRISPSALLLDNRGKIAVNWQHKQSLSEWRISQNEVVVHNPSNSIILAAGLRNISATFEMPATYEEFQTLAGDFSLNVIETIQPRRIERVGIRLQLIAEKPHFRTLVTKMRTKLYTLKEADWNIFGGYPEDIGLLSLIFKDQENQINFSTGPMEKAQLAEHFQSEEAKAKLPGTFVFVDMDLFSREPKWNNKSVNKQVLNYLADGGAKIQALAKSFLDNYEGFE